MAKTPKKRTSGAGAAKLATGAAPADRAEGGASVWDSSVTILRALGNEQRLRIMRWLLDPRAHFPPQRDGDLVTDGVCVNFITAKLGLSQPTVTSHLKILTKAGLVTSKRIKTWTFFKPVPDRAVAALEKVARAFQDKVSRDKASHDSN